MKWKRLISYKLSKRSSFRIFKNFWILKVILVSYLWLVLNKVLICNRGVPLFNRVFNRGYNKVVNNKGYNRVYNNKRNREDKLDKRDKWVSHNVIMRDNLHSILNHLKCVPVSIGSSNSSSSNSKYSSNSSSKIKHHCYHSTQN